MSLCPILLIPPSLVLPPVECCLGMRPSQAAKFRPPEKAFKSGAKAMIAPAVTGPTPGTVHNLFISSLTLMASRSFNVSPLILAVSVSI